MQLSSATASWEAQKLWTSDGSRSAAHRYVGKTTFDNAQLLCVFHNRSKGSGPPS